MREDNAQIEDLAYIKGRIRKLKENHIEDLQRLYTAQGEEFREEQMDKYISKGEFTRRPPDPTSLKKQEVCCPATSWFSNLTMLLGAL